RDDGIELHVLGVGTPEGGEVPLRLQRAGRRQVMKPIVSRLDEEALGALAAAGGGRYVRAEYLGGDTAALAAAITSGEVSVSHEDVKRVWSERFYIPLALLMVLVLMRMRRMELGLR
ncbi:MAG: VWA domain-containing protein, partial [Myxococcota bacterium]|nr:VWA domain-containing protein [Myxococcota bacterium]